MLYPGDPPATNGHTQGVADDEKYDEEEAEEEGAPATGTQAISQTQVQRDLALGDDEAFEAKYRERIQREIEEKGAKRAQKVGVRWSFTK